jgi:hypothetical protein
MIYTVEIESDRDNLQGDPGHITEKVLMNGEYCHVRQSVKHVAPPNRTPLSALDALWTITRSNQRPGHVDYLSKSEIVALAERALMITS